VDAASVPNVFGRFTLKGADIEIGGPKPFVALSRAKLIDISQNSVLGGASKFSWIEIEDADGGCVVGNALNNSGLGALSGSGSVDFVAAIKVVGCRNLLVASNNLTATDGADYGGFGILSCDGRRSAGGNFVTGNAVSAPYHSAAWNGQGRYINVVAVDSLGSNYIAPRPGRRRPIRLF
jgi:hypothetical protein